MGWLRRREARRRLDREIAIFYHPSYAPARVADTPHGIDPRRAERAIASLLGEGLLETRDVRPPRPASLAQLGRFHDLRYLESTADPDVLARIFGLDPAMIDIDRLLRGQRRAVGGTIAAGEAVAFGGRRLAINLGGGLHHAEPERGAGFCVYNDVAVAIAALRARGFAEPVAIVDLDFHEGNGNLVGFGGDPSVLLYSIDGSTWSSVQVGPNARIIALPPGTGDERYLEVLRSTLPRALVAHRPRIIFYIAGADVLAGDRLGTFRLSLSGALARDRHVLAAARTIGAGVVVTLGGGYGPDAWRAIANLMRFALAGDPRWKKSSREVLREEFERIARAIDPFELQRESGDGGFELTAADLDDTLLRHRPPRRFFDYYSAQGLELGMERYGIAAALRARGYDELEVKIDATDPAHQMARVFGRHARARDHDPPSLLLELVACRRTAPSPPGLDPDKPLSLLSIEWLLLQDEHASFRPDRRPLPGQTHPGLGIASKVRELLVQAALRFGLDGLVDRPAHYHNAMLARATFHFLDAEDEGRFLAMLHVLGHRPLSEASVLVDAKGLVLADGTALAWSPRDHVLPISERLSGHFESELYRGTVDRERTRLLEAGLQVRDDVSSGSAPRTA